MRVAPGTSWQVKGVSAPFAVLGVVKKGFVGRAGNKILAVPRSYVKGKAKEQPRVGASEEETPPRLTVEELNEALEKREVTPEEVLRNPNAPIAILTNLLRIPLSAPGDSALSLARRYLQAISENPILSLYFTNDDFDPFLVAFADLDDIVAQADVEDAIEKAPYRKLFSVMLAEAERYLEEFRGQEDIYLDLYERGIAPIRRWLEDPSIPNPYLQYHLKDTPARLSEAISFLMSQGEDVAAKNASQRAGLIVRLIRNIVTVFVKVIYGIAQWRGYASQPFLLWTDSAAIDRSQAKDGSWQSIRFHTKAIDRIREALLADEVGAEERAPSEEELQAALDRGETTELELLANPLTPPAMLTRILQGIEKGRSTLTREEARTALHAVESNTALSLHFSADPRDPLLCVLTSLQRWLARREFELTLLEAPARLVYEAILAEMERYLDVFDEESLLDIKKNAIGPIRHWLENPSGFAREYVVGPRYDLISSAEERHLEEWTVSVSSEIQYLPASERGPLIHYWRVLASFYRAFVAFRATYGFQDLNEPLVNAEAETHALGLFADIDAFQAGNDLSWMWQSASTKSFYRIAANLRGDRVGADNVAPFSDENPPSPEQLRLLRLVAPTEAERFHGLRAMYTLAEPREGRRSRGRSQAQLMMDASVGLLGYPRYWYFLAAMVENAIVFGAQDAKALSLIPAALRGFAEGRVSRAEMTRLYEKVFEARIVAQKRPDENFSFAILTTAMGALEEATDIPQRSGHPFPPGIGASYTAMNCAGLYATIGNSRTHRMLASANPESWRALSPAGTLRLLRDFVTGRRLQ